MEFENPAAQRLRILLVEDDVLFREQVEKYLGVYNDLESADSLEQARAIIARENFDVAILDKHLPDGTGLDLIAELRERSPATVILILTSDPNLNLVRKCLDAGASDYLQKSENVLPELLIRLPLAIRNAALKRKNEALEQKLDHSFRYEIVGHSPATAELRRHIDDCAGSSAPVLIVGESGTGKELIARRINALRCKGRRFVTVNCGAIPENLVESELFGHARGAFTNAHQEKAGLFELADGGDLFLDEIGELPIAAQAKLLRALQEGEIRRVGDNRVRRVRVRIIAATNRPLEEMVSNGSFREDLFYRLNVFLIRATPLRERTVDIPDLARYFLDQLANGKVQLSSGAERILADHSWPGNIRELRNSIERALISARRRKSAILEKQDLQMPSRMALEASRKAGLLPALPGDDGELRPGSLDQFLQSCERAYLSRVLDLCEGSPKSVSRVLGISRTTLFRRITDLAIDRSGLGLKIQIGKRNSTGAVWSKQSQEEA